MLEREIIELISGLGAAAAPEEIVGIGDDCAVIGRGRDGLLLLSTDTLVEGVHFDLAWHPVRLLGRKTAAVNISDIAAMGGRPLYALLSMALPDDFREQGLGDFLKGFEGRLSEYGLVLIGGDTVKSSGPLMFTVTVLGTAPADQVLYRGGARPGDEIWVSGILGEAAAGLELCRRGLGAGKKDWAQLVRAHLDPEPLVKLGRLLAESGLVGAMLDLSDGLATDLAHICKASGVGAEIEVARLPGSAALEAAAGVLRLDPLAWQLKGGEDYQLLFTLSPGHGEELRQRIQTELGREICRLGEITSEKGVFLCRSDDGGRLKKEEISYQGYDHFLTNATS